MLIRAILPKWVENSNIKKVEEGDYDVSEIRRLNELFYNIYYLPNGPSIYDASTTVDGSHIDNFSFVFVDMDLKERVYADKDQFIERLGQFPLLPSLIVDSGNGIHAYWRVSDLDSMTFLKLQRRLCRELKTDEAVSKIYQLMRLPGTTNTKNKDNFTACETLLQDDVVYSPDQLDSVLSPITPEDEEYCKNHFNLTYSLQDKNIRVNDKLPVKFGMLLSKNAEVKDIWSGNTDDRSKSDYRLGHIMFASGFTKDEATSVLVNSGKALARSPKHRLNYAANIIDKIWTYEEIGDINLLNLSSTVKEILQKSGDTLKGIRFPCYRYLDNTAHGFRLGQVIGLVAGSGVGKTAVALNMFMGFVEQNPDFEHFFAPLEQTGNEIADRWRTMCGDRTYLYDKVHVISNYDHNDAFRNLSLDEIKDYLVQFQLKTGKKIGCVVIDHIGALKKKNANGENQDLMTICHSMKSFAVQTNTLLIMQSQSSREKAGIGDIELNKDAAYGTVYFESYCDYLITIWQPLKRMYKNPACPTVTAFKFCKIRHKKKGSDIIQEDVPYILSFDPETEHLRELTQLEEKSFDYFNTASTNLRKKDLKTDLVVYTTIQPQTKKETAIDVQA